MDDDIPILKTSAEISETFFEKIPALYIVHSMQ